MFFYYIIIFLHLNMVASHTENGIACCENPRRRRDRDLGVRSGREIVGFIMGQTYLSLINQ
jgi:hypothetical protein